nr:SAM-dependent methyltransferase [Streptosporangium lutulentum]
MLDTRTPNVARMYDYYLGGKDNFAADRAAAQKIIDLAPDAPEKARANRAFLGRTVRYLAAQGIRQFVDIGAGLPTQENVHQVALAEHPDSRIVYVDNDPVVLTHARALLADNPNTLVVEGDVHAPQAILDHPDVQAHLDFDRPVATLLLAVLHFVQDDEEANRIVASLRERLVPGSHLVISHIYPGNHLAETIRAGARIYDTTTASLTGRSLTQIAGYFAGDMEVLEPGVVPVQAWRPVEKVGIDLVAPGILGAVGKVLRSRVRP